ncbi:hypothetical protein MNBD_CHLOROFLEXI01-3874 [hydrothermal vent metagenome]|uniref:VWFA domain-containing protein n=1 Tax=hydrothermal vent metagenome TaxID=652676 RepID=A0A3B0VBS5_9ZZZZ
MNIHPFLESGICRSSITHPSWCIERAALLGRFFFAYCPDFPKGTILHFLSLILYALPSITSCQISKLFYVKIRDRFVNNNFRHSICFALLFLLFLAACGGGSDEAVEESTDTDSSAADEATDSEAVTDPGVEATGSEEDSGSLPPTPDPGSKVNATRVSTQGIAAAGTAVITPTNRLEEQPVANQIDLVLLIDATGSMTQELSSLQAGLATIASQLNMLPESVTLRYGFVTYQDQTKTEDPKIFYLTDDWNLFAESLVEVTAVGGGDYAENLSEGLNLAVTGMNWQPDTTAKLIILLGDAPPHLDSSTVPSYEETSLLTQEQNIILFTIGSDGLDAQGEEIYQQIAQIGSGRYIFLTDELESQQSIAETVYRTADLATAITDILQEVVNELP